MNQHPQSKINQPMKALLSILFISALAWSNIRAQAQICYGGSAYAYALDNGRQGTGKRFVLNAVETGNSSCITSESQVIEYLKNSLDRQATSAYAQRETGIHYVIDKMNRGDSQRYGGYASFSIVTRTATGSTAAGVGQSLDATVDCVYRSAADAKEALLGSLEGKAVRATYSNYLVVSAVQYTISSCSR